jgi:hypothetical protein
VHAVGDLVIAPAAPEDKAYLETNHIIIEEALSLARALQQKGVAIRVWEGKTRGEGDLTEEFGEYAKMKGLGVVEVMTR